MAMAFLSHKFLKYTSAALFCILFVSQRSLNMVCMYMIGEFLPLSGSPGGDVVQIIILL
jgi:hypothetical protein